MWTNCVSFTYKCFERTFYPTFQRSFLTPLNLLLFWPSCFSHWPSCSIAMVFGKSKLLPVTDGNSEDTIVHKEAVLFAIASPSVFYCSHLFFMHLKKPHLAPVQKVDIWSASTVQIARCFEKKKKKIPVWCKVEMGLSLWNVWACRMQMNQLIEKSMPEPRLCLFSPLFGRITERTEWQTKLFVARKLLRCYLHTYNMVFQKRHLICMCFNLMALHLSWINSRSLIYVPRSKTNRISDHFHQVLYESQCGSGGPAQVEVPTAEHPCGGNTLSKSGWTSLWLRGCGLGIFISRLRCFLMSWRSCTPWWGGEAAGNRLQHNQRAGRHLYCTQGGGEGEHNKQSLIVCEIEDLGL